MVRFLWRLLLVAALSLACLGVALGWLWHVLHTPVSPPAQGALVSVAPGEPFRTTSSHLHAAGVVRHEWALRLWARWAGLDRLVRPGDYRFEHALSPIDVLERLRSPMAALHRVTIPEGTTVSQAAALLANAGFGGADQFLCLARNPSFLLSVDVPASGLEGYLFPDTYAFAWSTPPAHILAAMVERFRHETAPLQALRLDAGVAESDMVILASIIEKETGTPDERVLVSAVLRNRLQLGMPLQSDPTAIYGREIRGRPTASDMAVESPYNTYLHTGLPPGPICNPGLASLRAALTPANVPYLYFVSRNDGTHVFSRSLAEHNRAVARYQRQTNRP